MPSYVHLLDTDIDFKKITDRFGQPTCWVHRMTGS